MNARSIKIDVSYQSQTQRNWQDGMCSNTTNNVCSKAFVGKCGEE